MFYNFRCRSHHIENLDGDRLYRMTQFRNPAILGIVTEVNPLTTSGYKMAAKEVAYMGFCYRRPSYRMRVKDYGSLTSRKHSITYLKL